MSGKYVRVDDVVELINTPNRGTCDYFIVDQIEELCESEKVYDIDKVAAQLEKYCFEKYCAEGDSEIERIVKGGGADLELECKWKLEEEGNLYVTECENRHIAFDGTPEENGYRYCPYCGKKIKEVD